MSETQDLQTRLLSFLRRPPSLSSADQRSQLFAAVRSGQDFLALHPGPFLLGISLAPIEAETGQSSVFLVELRAKEDGPRKVVVSLGRSQDSDICIQHGMVSKLHATFQSKQGQWSILDAGSSNGVGVEGEKLEAYDDRAIVDGCRIEIGGAARCWFLDAPRVRDLLLALAADLSR